MCKWISWRSITAFAVAAFAIVIFKRETSRRSDHASNTDNSVQPPVPDSDTRKLGTAHAEPDLDQATPRASPVPLVSEVIVAPPRRRGTSRGARRVAPSREQRRIPRAIALGVIALAIIPVSLAAYNLAGTSRSPASITAEAVDTEQGVLMLVRGEHFDGDSSVRIFWHHPDDDAVTVSASHSGEVVVYAPLPGAGHGMPASADGTIDLVATDGLHEARISYAMPAPSQPIQSVLGATASSRIQVNGSPYFLLGANLPWSNYGNDFGSNLWGSYGIHANSSVAAQFADMKAKGVHVARWFIFADGRAGINYAADGAPIGLQPVVYDDLNAALALARQNNIYLDLVLFDISIVAKPNSISGVQIGGHTDLLNSPTKRAALVNNVVKPLAVRYANEPMILSWELMNEPEWGISDLPSAAVNAGYNPVTMQQFWSFASDASSLLHFYSRAQITIGSAALKWNKVWTDAFAASRGLPQLHLDFYQTHYYQWMDCCSTNDPVLGQATWSPLTQQVSTLGLDKPIVGGELHTPSGSAGAMLDTMLANGYAGVWGWSYNSGATTDNYVIDWNTYTPWEAQHAAIVRIPAPAATNATVTPAATNTSTSVLVKPTKGSPTAAPVATRTSSPGPTRTSSPIATQTTAATATRAAVSTATPPSGQTLVFGHTSAAGVNDGSDWNYINGTNAALTGNGALTSLSAYAGAVAPGSHLRLALFTSNGFGMPASKIAETGSALANPGWNTLATLQQPSIASGGYWITVQTDAAATVFRLSSGAGGTSFVGWTPQPYGTFPASIAGWNALPNSAFAAYGTIQVGGQPPSVTPQPTVGASNATPSPASTMGIPPNTTVVPMTATATPTRSPTQVPPSPTRTATQTPPPTPTSTPANGGGCVSNCGDPRYFCDTWTTGFCDDYRAKGSGATQIPFPAAADPYSFDCFSSTNIASVPYQPYYDPTMNVQNVADGLVPAPLPFPCAFSSNEHIMTRMEDGQFGMAVMRLQQPFDFANREGHFHFDVDLKVSFRRYVRIMFSPDLTKAVVDDRDRATRSPKDEFALWFQNGRLDASVTRGGTLVGEVSAPGTYYGVDNVRDHVDVYITRTHVRVLINGAEYLNTSVPDMGFDRAYPYLTQVSYNPCKAFESFGDPHFECESAAQLFHWDNIAFDGPKLPINSLTPANSQDVIFTVYSATACNVKGYPAAPAGDLSDYRWQTWVARMPKGTAVTAADVACPSGGAGFHIWDGIARGFEIAKQ